MKKILLVAAVLWAMPIASFAATVSYYSANATINATLVSATYVYSGVSAYDALNLSQWQYGGDFNGFESGTGTYLHTARLDRPIAAGMQFSKAITAEGYASSDEPLGWSGAAGWNVPSLVYQSNCYLDCASFEQIRLTFDYSVQTSVVTTIFDAGSGSASAFADAVLGFQYLQEGNGGCCNYDLAIENGTGRYSVNLTAGDGIGLDLYIKNVTGRADYTALSAVPLPAALPLLVVGLSGLGFIGRCKKKAS